MAFFYNRIFDFVVYASNCANLALNGIPQYCYHDFFIKSFLVTLVYIRAEVKMRLEEIFVLEKIHPNQS